MARTKTAFFRQHFRVFWALIGQKLGRPSCQPIRGQNTHKHSEMLAKETQLKARLKRLQLTHHTSALFNAFCLSALYWWQTTDYLDSVIQSVDRKPGQVIWNNVSVCFINWEVSISDLSGHQICFWCQSAMVEVRFAGVVNGRSNSMNSSCILNSWQHRLFQYSSKCTVIIIAIALSINIRSILWRYWIYSILDDR